MVEGSADMTGLVPATGTDVELLVAMMEEFYGEAAYPFDAVRARRGFTELLSTPHHGQSFVIVHESRPAGYLVLTRTFSMEYGGRSAFIDDLYVRPAHRGRGVAAAALEALRAVALDLDVRAIHLEIERDNAAAQAVYRRAGFEAKGRQLLTLRLA